MVSPVADRRAAPAISVVFPAGRGVKKWEARNAESPVPSRWPYGLDRLASPENQISAVEIPELGRLARATAERLGMRRRSHQQAPSSIALCWDELTATRMVHSVAAERMLAGVIWATDEVVAGVRSPPLTIARKALKVLDAVWVLSRPQQDVVSSWLGPDAPPVHFLQFGIDEEFYAFAPYPPTPLVASVGGDRDRDPATLFAALAMVLKKRPDVDCVVQSKSDLPVPSGVTKVANLPHDQVRRLFARASVVALATKPNWHASGMTVALEAMSVGRPVVASATPGMDDYIVDGQTGSLVPPEDPSAMAEQILLLLEDEERARRMGVTGRAAVDSRHTTALMCENLLNIVNGRV